MAFAGVIDPDARMELLDGELIDMPQEGFEHLTWKSLLARHFSRCLGIPWLAVIDAPIVLSLGDTPKPDVYIVDEARHSEPVDPSTVPLLVEVSDTTLAHDLKRKASKYAAYGIAEYWVVDLNGRETTIFTEPRPTGYAFERRFGFDERITPARLPEAGVVIGALKPR